MTEDILQETKKSRCQYFSIEDVGKITRTTYFCSVREIYDSENEYKFTLNIQDLYHFPEKKKAIIELLESLTKKYIGKIAPDLSVLKYFKSHIHSTPNFPGEFQLFFRIPQQEEDYPAHLEFLNELETELRKISIKPAQHNIKTDISMTSFLSFCVLRKNSSGQPNFFNNKIHGIFKYLNENIKQPSEEKELSLPPDEISHPESNHFAAIKKTGRGGTILNAILLGIVGTGIGAMELTHLFHKFETVDQFNQAVSENLDVVKTIFGSYSGVVFFFLALWAIASLVEKNCVKMADSKGEEDNFIFR